MHQCINPFPSDSDPFLTILWGHLWTQRSGPLSPTDPYGNRMPCGLGCHGLECGLPTQSDPSTSTPGTHWGPACIQFSLSQSVAAGGCRACRMIFSNQRKSQPVTRQIQARSTSSTIKNPGGTVKHLWLQMTKTIWKGMDGTWWNRPTLI